MCKPLELTPEQIAQVKKIQQKEQEEKQKLEKEELEKKKAEFEKLSDEEKKKFGLGDAVALIAQPIAKTIDSVVGTNIQNCGGCKKRQEALNNIIPDIKILKD